MSEPGDAPTQLKLSQRLRAADQVQPDFRQFGIKFRSLAGDGSANCKIRLQKKRFFYFLQVHLKRKSTLLHYNQ